MSLSALGLLNSGSAAGSASTNAAIARCCQAWQLRYNSEKSKGEDDVFAAHYADDSYRDAMPPLTGYKSIRDFIACAAHGMLIGAILSQNGTQILYAAQVALGALRHQTKQTKPPGRPKSLLDK